MNVLPFVKAMDGDQGGVDGWVVEPSGDNERDYAKGQEFARLAIEAAREMNDAAPITFTMAWIYAKAHLAGAYQGAMEKGFIDQIAGSAMRASLN